jgi:hypothetical protein
MPENRKYRACSRRFFNLRAPENLRFGKLRLVYARFSLLSTEPVPFRRFVCQKKNAFARTSPFTQEIRIYLSLSTIRSIAVRLGSLHHEIAPADSMLMKQVREIGPPGAAGNTLDQNRQKLCRGGRLGLLGELESERKKEIPAESAARQMPMLKVAERWFERRALADGVGDEMAQTFLRAEILRGIRAGRMVGDYHMALNDLAMVYFESPGLFELLRLHRVGVHEAAAVIVRLTHTQLAAIQAARRAALDTVECVKRFSGLGAPALSAR